ncbi:MAG TPA: hypothetical protein VFK02_18365 [Kofleriaceae bacterium]|nr:hypothetical protein [Kofleriaceae bacterium]
MAVFELGGALAAGLPELSIGPWTRTGAARDLPARTAAGLVAFDLDAAPEAAPESVWRVELVRAELARPDALGEGERDVAQVHAALDDAPRQIDRLLEQMLSGTPGAPAAERAARAATGRAPIRLDEIPVFEADPDAAGGEPEPPGRIEQVLHHIADLARGRARIETLVEGALMARSVMRLSGRTELWVAPRLSLAGASLHARSVTVALGTRHAWTRIVALVLGYCHRLALFGLPAGVLALPGLWRLLRDLLREVRHVGAIRSST